ncbi:hypothetical protein H1P_7030002 [Hyella patelloides LEGE 07179]|uniref:Uncharacterized protein n=1 Tax=Hyella patelloides LEGE 07179 TaxID=945734 RepID=A0A563W3J6_9CYAN|nr:hypothetical protein H1P_7030002 [Hyella patelloides LEGE 07179]
MIVEKTNFLVRAKKLCCHLLREKNELCQTYQFLRLKLSK